MHLSDLKAKLYLFFLTFLPTLLLDRYTKTLAVEKLQGEETISFLNGIFSLTYHENTGAMLSFGSNFSDLTRFWLFTVLVAIVLLIWIGYIFFKSLNRVEVLIGLLICSGGFGNLYDRAFNDGRVVDFMLVQFGPLRTGVFNVADVVIMLGLFGFILVAFPWHNKVKNLTNLFSRFSREC